MAEEVSVSRTIRAPAEQVWVMVSDVTRMGEWSPENVHCEWVKGATGAVPGAKFKGTNQNGKKSWSTDATVLDAAAGRRFSFRVDVGPVKVSEWAYSFEDAPDGCVVTETWTDRRNGLIKRLSKPLSGVENRAVHNRAGMEQTLDRLAEAAEAAPASAADDSPPSADPT